MFRALHTHSLTQERLATQISKVLWYAKSCSDACRPLTAPPQVDDAYIAALLRRAGATKVAASLEEGRISLVEEEEDESAR